MEQPHQTQQIQEPQQGAVALGASVVYTAIRQNQRRNAVGSESHGTGRAQVCGDEASMMTQHPAGDAQTPLDAIFCDHASIIPAASKLAAELSRCQFRCAGPGSTPGASHRRDALSASTPPHCRDALHASWAHAMRPYKMAGRRNEPSGSGGKGIVSVTAATGSGP